MALDKNIKGITIELGGNTSKLDSALKDVGEQSRKLQSELNAVERLLKFDPENVDLLTQKQRLLNEQMELASKKTEAFHQAQERVKELFARGEIDEGKYRDFERQLISAEQQLERTSANLKKTENALNGFEEAVEDAGESTITFGDLLKSNIAGDLIADGLQSAADAAKEFAVQSIELAGTAQKVQEAVDATFGSSADIIEKWAASSADNFGISAKAAKQYTTDLGGLIKSFEVTADKAADMSVNMVGLAGDLASFHQRDLQEAFDKVRAGIEGDVEQLKDFGINMSEAKLEAYAFSQGIKTAYSELSEAEQVQLRYNYLMQATSEIQGNFSRTSKDTANQQQILKANIENMSVSLGEKLLPSVNNVLATVNEKLPSIEPKLETIGTLIGNITEFAIENADAIMGMAAGYAAFTGANAIGNGIMTVVNSVKALKTANDAATVSQNAMNAAANANPYILLASAIAAVTVGLVTYANTADTAHNRLKDIKNEIENLNQATEDNIKTTESEIAVLESKAEKYEELRVKANRTAGEEQQLIELAKELQAYMPEGTFLINEQTGAYNSLAGSINSVTEAMRLNAQISAYKDEYDGLTKKLYETQEQFDELDRKLKNEGAFVASDGTIAFDNFLDGLLNVDDMMEWENAKSTIDGINDELSELDKKIESVYETTAKTSDKVAVKTSLTASYYEKQGKAALSAVETIEDYETATQTALDEIEHRYKTHQLTEQEYYAEIERYLKSHANAESELYWEMSDRVSDYYAGLKETAVKTQETVTKVTKKETDNRLDLLKKELETQLSEYEKNLSSIQGKVDSLADKFTAEFKDKFTFSTDDDGKFKMEVDGDFIVDKNAELEKYLAQIDNLKKRGISDDLLQQLSNMTVEEGMKVAEYYGSLTDQQLKNLTDHWNEYNETSRKLAESLYADEVEQVTNSYVDGVVSTLNETAPELQQAGLAMAQALVSGFDVDGVGAENLAQLKAHISEMLSQALNGRTSGIPSAQDKYLDECLKQLYERDKAFAEALNSSTDKVAEVIKDYNLNLPDLTGLSVPTVQNSTTEKTEDFSAKRHIEIMDMLAEMYEVLLQKQKLTAEFELKTELVLDNEKFGRLVSGVIRKEV